MESIKTLSKSAQSSLHIYTPSCNWQETSRGKIGKATLEYERQIPIPPIWVSPTL